MSPADPNYLAHREREIRVFEARANGEIPHHPKRQPQNGADTMLQTAEETAPIIAPPRKQRRVRVPAEVTINGAPTSLSIVHAALASGNVEMYREAVTLMKEMDAFAARKAFNNALADAAAELPLITKNQRVSYDRKTGGTTSYWHEDLAQVVDTVVPTLAKFGLKHRWMLNGKPGEPVTVTCIISHRDGHQEENSLSAGADTSDGKNPIQGVKSAVSYLERITLMASLGLASRKDDDDGRSVGTKAAAPAAAPPGTISASQAAELRKLLEDRGIRERAFLNYIRLPSIEHIGVEHFERAKAAIIAQGRKS